MNLTNAFNLSDCENGTGFWFNLTVNGTGVNWYDPVYAVGYDFEVLSGPKFASVVVPPGYGDDKYDIISGMVLSTCWQHPTWMH